MKDVGQLIEELEAENAKLKIVASRQSRSKALLAALRKYRCQYTLDHDGNPLDLIDVLSPTDDVSAGGCEMQRLADYLDDVLAANAALSGGEAVRSKGIVGNLDAGVTHD